MPAHARVVISNWNQYKKETKHKISCGIQILLVLIYDTLPYIRESIDNPRMRYVSLKLRRPSSNKSALLVDTKIPQTIIKLNKRQSLYVLKKLKNLFFIISPPNILLPYHRQAYDEVLCYGKFLRQIRTTIPKQIRRQNYFHHLHRRQQRFFPLYRNCCTCFYNTVEIVFWFYHIFTSSFLRNK